MLFQDSAELIYLPLTNGTVRQPAYETARELKHGRQPGSAWAVTAAHQKLHFYTSLHTTFTEMNALSWASGWYFS